MERKVSPVFAMVAAVMALFLQPGCSRAQQVASGKKVLIVYLSRTNNTKAVAGIIQRHAGGDLVVVETVDPYPADYRKAVEQVARENATGYLPPLKTRIDSIGRYDIVFVGFPTWGMQLPPPMKSFLHQHDLAGKTVIPFNTNGGYGTGSSFAMVKQLCPRSKVLEGYAVEGGLERDGKLLVIKGEKAKTVDLEVAEWLKRIALISQKR